MGILSVALVVVSGRLLEEVLDLIGLSGAAVTVATIVRWPVAVILLLFAVAVVRWAAPASRRGRFRLVTPGSLVAVAVWLAATAGYAIYVSYLSSYNDTYGAFTGAVILLLWLWLGAAALLYGAELDAVLRERGRG
jgi:membrane protein